MKAIESKVFDIIRSRIKIFEKGREGDHSMVEKIIKCIETLLEVDSNEFISFWEELVSAAFDEIEVSS